MSELARLVLGRFRIILERDLMEQSVAERLAKAMFIAALLWATIGWALS